MNTTNSTIDKSKPIAQGNNSPFIVVHTSTGTVRKPNPNYTAPKSKGILSKIFGG